MTFWGYQRSRVTYAAKVPELGLDIIPFRYYNLSMYFVSSSCIQKLGMNLNQLQHLTPPPQFSSVQSLSRVWHFATPWPAAHRASQSISNSRSLLKLLSIQLVMPSNHLILRHLLLLPPSIFPSIKVFSMSQFFASGGQSTRISASASILSRNIQDWFPLGWTCLISL